MLRQPCCAPLSRKPPLPRIQTATGQVARSGLYRSEEEGGTIQETGQTRDVADKGGCQVRGQRTWAQQGGEQRRGGKNKTNHVNRAA